jgi:integrase
MPLTEARKQAARITSGAKDGHDPQAQREAKKRQEADTFGALVELYLARYAARRQRPRTLIETTRGLRVYLVPLHKRPLTEITRRDVAARLMELVDTAGPIAANRTRAALSHCFSWAMQQGLAENNPVVGTARPAPETKRERVLRLDELRTVWRAAGDDDYGRIVKLLILTGQRREEVGGMAEAELDREASLWVLPSTRTKSGLEHEVPLAPLALQIIGEARPGRSHMFGRRRAGYSGWAYSKARLDERIAAEGATMAHWTVHDVRRSFVTQMNEHKITQPHIIEAVVNHISGDSKAGVAGVYNRAKYRTEKRVALTAWAEFVSDLVAPARAAQ